MKLRFCSLAVVVAAGVAIVAPVGVLADDGDPGTIMTEQSLWGCESYYRCGQPGLDRWSIDLTVGGVGDLNVLSDERVDPVRGAHIRGVARATFGKLGVSAFVDPPDGFHSGGPGGLDFAEMRANAKYEDVITVVGAAGAPGVPIHLYADPVGLRRSAARGAVRGGIRLAPDQRVPRRF